MKNMAEINPFAEAMAKRSDADLIEIVIALRDDYQPEAVVAAESELRNRHLSEEEIEKARSEL